MIGKESHGTIAEMLACASREQQLLCRALRELIVCLDKSCTEIAWPKQRILSFGVGPKKMSQHYAYIAVHSAHINLGFYQGASLPDPASLLEGSGKALRHVKVNDLAVIKSAALETLLRVAITERTPYADRVSDGSVHTNTTLPITSRR